MAVDKRCLPSLVRHGSHNVSQHRSHTHTHTLSLISRCGANWCLLMERRAAPLQRQRQHLTHRRFRLYPRLCYIRIDKRRSNWKRTRCRAHTHHGDPVMWSVALRTGHGQWHASFPTIRCCLVPYSVWPENVIDRRSRLSEMYTPKHRTNQLGRITSSHS